jgi:hypothetical protein
LVVGGIHHWNCDRRSWLSRSNRPWCFAVGSDRFLVFTGEIRSTLGVLQQNPTGLDVLWSFPTCYWCFPARFDQPWCFAARSNHLLQFSGEFSTSVKVFGEFLFGVAF